MLNLECEENDRGNAEADGGEDYTRRLAHGAVVLDAVALLETQGVRAKEHAEPDRDVLANLDGCLLRVRHKDDTGCRHRVKPHRVQPLSRAEQRERAA